MKDLKNVANYNDVTCLEMMAECVNRSHIENKCDNTDNCPNCTLYVSDKIARDVLTKAMITVEKYNHSLEPNDYQQLAMRTCGIPYDDKKNMLMHSVLGLTSEAGELAGIFQKEYQGHEVDSEHIKKELGDCLWMIAECCTAMGFTMEDVMRTNIEKLMARYPEGFDPEKSLHRKEGDI